MKKLSIIVLMTALSTTLFCQKDKEELGKAETFFSEKGSMIEKTFKPIAKITSLYSGIMPIEVLKIKSILKNDSMYCIRMSAYYGSSIDTEVTGFIDSDEIDDVILFVELMNKNYLLQPSPANHVELYYRCESGFEIGCINGKNGWHIYLKPKYYSSATHFFEKQSYASISIAMKQAKDYIEAKK